MNFPIVCIFTMASIGALSAVVGSILVNFCVKNMRKSLKCFPVHLQKRSLMIEIYIVFGLITTLILGLVTVSAAFIAFHFFLLQLTLFSFFVYNILFMNSYSYQLIVASKMLTIDVIQVEPVRGPSNEYL